MLMHQDKFVTKWVAEIKARMTGMCEDGFVIPMIALFYNDAATADIMECKRKMRLELAAIEQRHGMLARLPCYSIFERLSGCLASWRDRMAVRIWVWRHQPDEEAVNKCLGSPEFEFLKYLHKLTERMAHWSSFSGQDCDYEDLPQEFRNVLGDMDPPHAEYSHLCELQKFADHYITPKMQRTMFIMMLSEKMSVARHVEPPHRA